MGKRRKIGSIISQEKRQLVLNSQVIKNYPDIEEILSKYDKIYKSDFEDTEDFSPEMQTKLLFGFDEIVAEAAKEWFASSFEPVEELSDDMEDWVHCQLCNAPNKYIFYIKNGLNGKELNVGSDCILKFPGIRDNIGGVSITTIKNNRIKEFKRIARINKFNSLYPDIASIIKNYKEDFYNNPIVLPLDIQNVALDLLNNLENMYTDYINGKLDDNVLTTYGDILKDYENYLKVIRQHTEDNINKKFVCDLETKKWLSDNGQAKVLQQIIKDGGFFTAYTICHIYNYPFVIKFRNDFVKKLEKSRFKITDITDRLIIFDYNSKTGDKFKFECLLKAFMLKHGDCLFDENKNIDEDSLMSVVSLAWDERNITNAIDKFNVALKNTPYSIEFDFEREEVEYKDKEKKLFARGQARIFCNAHKDLLFSDDNVTKTALLQLLTTRISSWKSEDEKKKYDIGDISKRY